MQRGQMRNCAGRSMRLGGLVVGLLLLLGVAPAVLAQDDAADKPAPDLTKEYQRRFNALEPGDVAGHYALAEWCREQGEYALAFEQAEYVLKLDPRHADARLLRTTALRKMNEKARPAAQAAAAAGLISLEDVQRLRFIELLDSQAAPVPANLRESVSVRFDRGLLNDFLNAMGDAPEFSGRANRQRFFALSPTERLQVIRQYSGLAYQPRIQIMNDPVVFRRFRPVLALIERGCATRDCHGGENPAPPFGLRSLPQYPEQSLYTQFLILDRVVLGRYRLIDRDRPAESLILQYGLPARLGRLAHPRVQQTEIKPLYPSGTNEPNYRMVLDWIDMLRTPRPLNGIRLEGYPEPPPPSATLASQPGGGASTRPAPIRY